MLWNNIGVELLETIFGPLNAGVYQEGTIEIQTRDADKTSEITISSSTNKVWKRSLRSNTRRYNEGSTRVGSILCYARAVDLMPLISLSTIVSEQAKATWHTIQTMEQLFDYMVSNPDATIRF